MSSRRSSSPKRASSPKRQIPVIRTEIETTYATFTLEFYPTEKSRPRRMLLNLDDLLTGQKISVIMTEDNAIHLKAVLEKYIKLLGQP